MCIQTSLPCNSWILVSLISLLLWYLLKRTILKSQPPELVQPLSQRHWSEVVNEVNAGTGLDRNWSIFRIHVSADGVNENWNVSFIPPTPRCTVDSAPSKDKLRRVQCRENLSSFFLVACTFPTKSRINFAGWMKPSLAAVGLRVGSSSPAISAEQTRLASWFHPVPARKHPGCILVAAFAKFGASLWKRSRKFCVANTLPCDFSKGL